MTMLQIYTEYQVLVFQKFCLKAADFFWQEQGNVLLITRAERHVKRTQHPV